MTIKFYPYAKDGAGVWRITIHREAASGLPEFANGNAARLMDDLGFGSEWHVGSVADPVAIDLFEQAVFLARTALDGKLSPATENRVLPGRGLTVIEFGQWEGRDNERLDQLTALIALGRTSGATHIGWG